MRTGAASSSRAREHATAAAAILLIALVGYGFLLTPGQAPFSPFSDFMALGLGAKTVLYESIHAGRGLPYWRGDEFSGNAALIDPQNAYLCPLNFLFFIWPPLKALGPTLWLYFLTAGLVGYVGGCTLQLGFWARLFMAAGLMFDFKLQIAGYAGWLPSFPGAITVPLLFLAVLRALEKPGRKSAALVGLAGGLSLFSGHPQLLYYSALFFVCLAFGNVFRDRRSAAPRLLTLGAGATLAVGLAACLLLPLAADAPLLSRGKASYHFFLSGHGLRLRHLRTLFAPEGLGTPIEGTYPPRELWEDVAYFGILPLLGCLAAAALSWRQARTRVLGGALVAALVLSLQSPLQRLLFELLPGFALFRVPARFLYLAGWFGIALGGVGLDEALRRLERRSRSWAMAGAGLVIIAAALEGGYYARRYLPMAAADRLLPGEEAREFFKRQEGPFRVIPAQRSALNYGWAAPLGISLASGYGSFNYSHYQTYCDIMRWGVVRPEGARVWTDVSPVSRFDLLDTLGVRYVVSRSPMILPRERFALKKRLGNERIFELYRGLGEGDLYVYENRGALPRAFFVDKTVLAKDSRAAVYLMQGTSLRGAAVVEAADHESEAAGTSADRVIVERSMPGALELRLRSSGPRYLVISEVWNPGWRALLDGAPLALRKTDVALMGAWVPPGAHRLDLSFGPIGWGIGLAVSLLSAVTLVTLRLPRFWCSLTSCRRGR